MRIAIASGKGGAGKTCVAASLSRVWPRPRIAVDADVEAPNLHIFLQPVLDAPEPWHLAVPAGLTSACTACGACRDICRYSAIARFGKKIKLFPDMCHGCGGCFAVCPEQALTEGKRELGSVARGKAAFGVPYIEGATRVGEVMTPPLLRRLLACAGEMAQANARAQGAEPDLICDCPPGVSCPAVTAARHAQALVMVADPTPFGFHDFTLAWQAFSQLPLMLGCVINRAAMPGNAGGDERVRAFCRESGLPVLAELPFEREAALAYSQGRLLADISPAWRQRFEDLAARMLEAFRNCDQAGCLDKGGRHARLS